MRGALAPITIDALRNLSVHGVTSLTAIKGAIAGLETKTMNNLVQLGHALRTEAGLSITPKGRQKLQWVDVIILAFDGAWRSGATPEQIVQAIVAKQTRNEGRKWPDWRTADPTKAIEHDRTSEAVS